MQVPSPLLMSADTTVHMDDLHTPADGGESGSDGTVGGTSMSVNGGSTVWPAPKTPTSRSKSGYILFSAEVRKRVMNENPEATFGEISRFVGEEWKKLPKFDKEAYESRAISKAKELSQMDADATPTKLAPGQAIVYQCKWQNCELQYDTRDALNDHVHHAHTSVVGMFLGSGQVVKSNMLSQPRFGSSTRVFVVHVCQIS
jgi:protein polybromo-1